MLGQLAGQRYISLTTYRRDGSTASTPVWVVSDDGERLLVSTGENTWKVKRIRSDPRVLVAPSDYRGRDAGPRGRAGAGARARGGKDRHDTAATQVRVAAARRSSSGAAPAVLQPPARGRVGYLELASVTSSSRGFSR